MIKLKMKNIELMVECTVPWVLIKSFEKSGFCRKIFKMHPFSVPLLKKCKMCIFFNFFPWDHPMGSSHGSAPDRSSSHGKIDVISHVSLPSQFQSNWNFENLTSFQLPPLHSHGSEGPIIHTIIHVNHFQYYKKFKMSLISCKLGV